MANSEHLKIVREGFHAIKRWREIHVGQSMDLKEGDLSGLELSDADLSNADLSRASLKGVVFYNIKLNGATLDKANMSDADLSGVILTSAKLIKTDLSGAILNSANLIGANLIDSNLTKAQLINADLQGANLLGAMLREADLTGANLGRANLTAADLSEANLVGADLTDANLNHANLLGIEINSTTKLHIISQVFECEMDRYSLEYLKSQSANLNYGMMMDMKIHDDLATLKSQFGGLWGAIHLTSIILFIVPYIWFLISIRPLAEFNHSTYAVTEKIQDVVGHSDLLLEGENSLEPITLLTALCRYIWSGGVDWTGECEFNFWPFSAFLFFLFYNANRGALLWKTKKLETEEAVTKLPVRFSLNLPCYDIEPDPNIAYFQTQRRFMDQAEKLIPSWNHIYLIVHSGIWIYIGFVLYNTLHFLQMEILI